MWTQNPLEKLNTKLCVEECLVLAEHVWNFRLWLYTPARKATCREILSVLSAQQSLQFILFYISSGNSMYFHDHTSLHTLSQLSPWNSLKRDVFCLSNTGTLPAARPSHFISLVCFVFLFVPQHAVGLFAYHSLSLSYVCGCGAIFI